MRRQVNTTRQPGHDEVSKREGADGREGSQQPNIYSEMDTGSDITVPKTVDRENEPNRDLNSEATSVL